MKKFLILLALTFAVAFAFSACNMLPGAPSEKEDVITVEDGYLVVNGVKTDYQVKTDDVIEVVDGYVVVNGVKTQYKVDTPDVIEVIGGYVYVNGVKTDIYVPDCNHTWTTTTTAPTCTAGGYDTKTCTLCGKSVKDNETAKLDHNYATTYSFDDNNHWFGCTGCDAKKDTAAHTPDDDGICTVCQTPISATPGVIYDISADGTYAEVIGYNGTASKVKIAAEYNGLPVTNIYDFAFSGADISSVSVPEGVISIGRSAFAGCNDMESIIIPSTIKSIGEYAFMGDGSINIYITNLENWCNASYGTYFVDSYYLYINNQLVEDLVTPNNVTRISEWAFHRCLSLKTVLVTSNVESIGDNAFGFCSNIETVNVKQGVLKIGSYAFSGCSALDNIEIPDSVIEFGWNIFDNCAKLKFTEYESCQYLGSSNNPYQILVKTSNNITSNYTIHSDTRTILPYAFANCSRLGNIVIPEGVITVGSYAFKNCTSINSVFIPKSVQYLGYGAFAECYSSGTIYYEGSESDWWEIINDDVGTIYKIEFNYVP